MVPERCMIAASAATFARVRVARRRQRGERQHGVMTFAGAIGAHWRSVSHKPNANTATATAAQPRMTMVRAVPSRAQPPSPERRWAPVERPTGRPRSPARRERKSPRRVFGILPARPNFASRRSTSQSHRDNPERPTGESAGSPGKPGHWRDAPHCIVRASGRALLPSTVIPSHLSVLFRPRLDGAIRA